MNFTDEGRTTGLVPDNRLIDVRCRRCNPLRPRIAICWLTCVIVLSPLWISPAQARPRFPGSKTFLRLIGAESAPEAEPAKSTEESRPPAAVEPDANEESKLPAPPEEADDDARAAPWNRTYEAVKTPPDLKPDEAPKKKGKPPLTKEQMTKAINNAYAGVFYANKFDYILDPGYNESFFGDDLKRMDWGDKIKADIGGQYRARYMHEQGFRGLGLTGKNDEFLLQRLRLFANIQLGSFGRVYAEGLDASSEFNRLPARGIEVSRFQLQNLFYETGAMDLDPLGKMTMRFGRQELLYGTQRLISPLDWANTRRTFDAARVLMSNDKYNFDLFVSHPVSTQAKHFNTPLADAVFGGGWFTYKGIKNQTFDFYALQYQNYRTPQHFNFTTLGNAWVGSEGNFLWDLEGGVQFGNNSNGSNHRKIFSTTGVGYKEETAPWKPTLWAYFDYADGGTPVGRGNGFNQLFPLGHKYLGFMDLYGRSNIESPNVLLTLQPTDKLKLLLWYYYFMLQRKSDSPYNVSGTAFNGANVAGSRSLGNELDLTAAYTINPRMDLLFGYSHFWSGAYYRKTPGTPFKGDADFFYTQFQWNF